MTRTAVRPDLHAGAARSGPGAQSQVRPRYGRLTAFGVATVVCGVTFLGGSGLIHVSAAPAPAQPDGTLSLSGAVTRSAVDVSAALGGGDAARLGAATGALGAGTSRATTDAPTGGRPDQGAAGEPQPAPAGSRPLPDVPPDATTAAADPDDFPLPARSGTGRRVVFDLDQQRVWLVRSGGSVKRTYLASGSVSDNLEPGTFEVYSRSADATGIDGSSMNLMVRFTRGDNAAIGFHDIPVMDGHPVQRVRELGTPLSHGCIRQAPADARALWRFAPVGTTVVVTG